MSIRFLSEENRVESRKVLKEGDSPVAHAIKATLRYHLGSIAVSAASVRVGRQVSRELLLCKWCITSYEDVSRRALNARQVQQILRERAQL